MIEKNNTSLGFTLVELSIVLIIIGLVVSGVIAGKSLIRAAEVRSAIQRLQKYQVAVITFQGKYEAYPGDIGNATDYWGVAVSDGDNNGRVDTSGSLAGQFNERFSFWQHLALAGMIEGSYTGRAGSADGNDHEPDENHPSSRISDSGWTVFYQGVKSGDAAQFDGSYGTVLRLGKLQEDNPPNDSNLSPQEILGMDSKIDDGYPSSGRITPLKRDGNCTSTPAGVPLTTSGADAASTDAVYYVQDTNINCSVIFRNIF